MDYTIAEDTPILDPAAAIRSCEDEDLFKVLLQGYDETLIRMLGDLKVAMDNVDYFQIRFQTHSLKSPSGYIKGERVRRAAEIVQKCADSQQPENIYKYYPLLIKESIKLRREVRHYLSKINSKEGGQKW